MVRTYRTEIEDCCGATLLHNFWQGEDRQGLGNFNSGHLYIAVLTESQSKKYSTVLKKNGFRVVSRRVVNSNSGNRLYLWTRDNPPKKRKMKSIWTKVKP